MSVCLYVISPSLIKIDLQVFLCRIPSYMSIYSIHILSVRLQKAEMKKLRNMIFSEAIYDKGQYYFVNNWCASILCLFCPSGYKRQKCRNKETWFSRWIYMIKIWFFFVKIRLINAHIFYEYFVRLSVRLQKELMYL